LTGNAAADRFSLITAKSFWAWIIVVAGRAAKGAFSVIDDTRILRGIGRAVRTGSTWQAEVRKARDTHIGGVGAAYEDALPSIGTGCITCFRADLIAHMGCANTRIAVVGLVASITEAARSRFALRGRVGLLYVDSGIGLRFGCIDRFSVWLDQEICLNVGVDSDVSRRGDTGIIASEEKHGEYKSDVTHR